MTRLLTCITAAPYGAAVTVVCHGFLRCRLLGTQRLDRALDKGQLEKIQVDAYLLNSADQMWAIGYGKWYCHAPPAIGIYRCRKLGVCGVDHHSHQRAGGSSAGNVVKYRHNTSAPGFDYAERRRKASAAGWANWAIYVATAIAHIVYLPFLVN